MFHKQTLIRYLSLPWLIIGLFGLLFISQRLSAGPSPVTAIKIQFEPFANINHIRPTEIANAGDSRLFIGSKGGLIYIVRSDGVMLNTPFLDIQDRVDSSEVELGLLGLVFDPDYATNRYFYVSYTNLEHDTVISRFRTFSNNPNRANPASERIILLIDQPELMHKAGDMSFGPDGYLYISVGDGGWYGDPGNNAQNGQLLLGSILRIDVTPDLPYTIPADNPFVNDPDYRDELWAKGLRNPWRFSFDRLTGDMYIGEVGEHYWEEVNLEPAGSPGGINYGWHCYEGLHPFEPDDCQAGETYQPPIFEYPHGDSCAIVGGYVYRGTQSPLLAGHYLLADFCSGMVLGLAADNTGRWDIRSTGYRPMLWSSFGEAADGEIYAVGLGGDTMYHLTATEISLPRQLYLPLVIR